MHTTDKRFTEENIELLYQVKGATLLSVDALLVAPPNRSWGAVRLHFDTFDIDINNNLQEIIIDEFDSTEEFGILSLSAASQEILSIPKVSANTIKFTVNERIEEIEVIDSLINVYGNGVLVSSIVYPQAVVFKTKSEYIVIDKEIWFSEMLAVKHSNDVDSLVYDDSVNWVDDPEEDETTHYEYATQAHRL